MLGLIDNLGFGEFMIVAVVALLVFGKRLPHVAGQAGAQLARLRRSLDTLWRETGVAREIRSVQNELHDVVPRNLSLGEMARMASADIQKSLREVELQEPAVPRTLPASESPPAVASSSAGASPPRPAAESESPVAASNAAVSASPPAPAAEQEPPSAHEFERRPPAAR